MSADLATRYLGLELSSPVVASASPLTGDVETVRALVDAGAAAVVMPSLFEEEILQEELELTRALEAGAEHFSEAATYFPSVPELVNAADRYVACLAELKGAVAVPIVASLNADTRGGWVRHAGRLASAGADAIELNLYTVAADPERSGVEVEAELLGVVADVRRAVEVPLAVKLSPYFSSMAHMARQVVGAGADGLVLFNRFYQPDIDLEALDVVPRVELSSRWELRLPLRWIAILRPLLPDTSLAATSGIASGQDVAKAVAAGADVAMMTSAVLRHGPGHVSTVIGELRRWLDDHGYASVGQLRGSMSYAASADPSAFERANYRQVLHSWTSPGELSSPLPPPPS
ncbi:dihydroorotate dehydrogenase-like protein [Rhabdothermincola sp.]|uniref:dihydroorotate dehydrogenase-like protein n=1 Tax=Rhabdothermincola sp. TaxID=2820405 RepID=UPI002FE374A6